MNKSRHIFTVVLAAVGGALLLAGAALFLVGLALEGWDVGALTNVQYEQHSYTAQDEIHSVHIRFRNAQVRVEADEGAERVTLSYPVRVDSEGETAVPVTVTEENGTLTVTGEEDRFPFFQWGFVQTTPEAVLTLPAGDYTEIAVVSSNGSLLADTVRAASLSLQTDNGSVTAREVCADDFSLRTSNGDIELQRAECKSITAETNAGSITADGVTVSGALALSSDLGDIRMKDIAAGSLSSETEAGALTLEGADIAGEADLQTDLGEIRVRGARAASAALTTDLGTVDAEIDAREVRLTSSAGEIRAALAGTKEDYTIRVQTELGDCNVVDRDGGTRSLTATTALGNIRVEFTG